MTALPEQLLRLPPEEVEELACRAHLGVWTARKRRLVMAPFLWEWCELAMTESRLCVVAPRDHGKALALDTAVMVPGGWRPMGHLEVGDTVIGATGHPTPVTAVSEVFTDHDCYRLELDDGQSFVADAGHRWWTYRDGYHEVTTEVIAQDMTGPGSAHRIDMMPKARWPMARSWSIVSCEPTLTVPVRCITTGTGSFLIGDEVPTLNSETFTVNAATWRSTYTPGIWTYVFSQTGDQAKEMITRIVMAMEETCPELVDPPRRRMTNDVVFANGARVTSAGAGKAVRGAHPDFIVGDDVLDESGCATELQRKRMERWWKGSVANMAHPGSIRSVRMDPRSDPVRVRMPATRVVLVGTPFHEQDLLLGMRGNPLYSFRRYSAEYRPEDLVPGTWAVESR